MLCICLLDCYGANNCVQLPLQQHHHWPAADAQPPPHKKHNGAVMDVPSTVSSITSSLAPKTYHPMERSPPPSHAQTRQC